MLHCVHHVRLFDKIPQIFIVLSMGTCQLYFISLIFGHKLEYNRGQWNYVQIAGNQPTRLFQTRYARFRMLKNVKNEFKILNVYKL